MRSAPQRRAVASLLVAAACVAGSPAGAQEPAAPDAMHVHMAEPGDTLIGLGQRLLAQPGRWPEVARLNRLRNPDRIPVGARLSFPLAWMRTESADATVISAAGDVRIGGQTLATDTPVPEGARITLGDDGQAVLRLVDGTVLRLRPGSQLQLSESRRVPRTPVTRSRALLQDGRVEVEAPTTRGGQPGFRIGTPQGVLGVRGTAFRVAVDTAGARTRGEVLEGTVAVSGATGTAERAVVAGFGTVVDAAGRVAPPVALLPPPDLAGLPRLQERVLLRFALPGQAGATAFRGRVARDDAPGSTPGTAFDTVLADTLAPGLELRFVDLPDGDYRLRVRAVDAQGLEGRDAEHRFTLKARPEAPLPSSPPPAARLFGGRVDLTWAANAQAGSYRLQLTPQVDDPGFERPLRELTDLRALLTTVDGLPPGRYHWRLRSVRPDGDAGPWGDPIPFELRPDPPAPQRPTVGDQSLRFAWLGLPGQRFDVQLARDEAFTDVVLARQTTETAIELPRPEGAVRVWVRLRAIDPDDFVGPFGTPQYVDLPHCLRDGGNACVRQGGEPVVTTP